MQFLNQLAAVCLLAGCVNAIVMPPDEDGTLNKAAEAGSYVATIECTKILRGQRFLAVLRIIKSSYTQ